MKKLMIVLILITMLEGCSHIVRVPVWTPPNVTMPEKPLLVSDGNGTDGEVARKLSVDLLKMNEYTTTLENTLKAIISTPMVPLIELKSPIINK